MSNVILMELNKIRSRIPIREVISVASSYVRFYICLGYSGRGRVRGQRDNVAIICPSYTNPSLPPLSYDVNVPTASAATVYSDTQESPEDFDLHKILD